MFTIVSFIRELSYCHAYVSYVEYKKNSPPVGGGGAALRLVWAMRWVRELPVTSLELS